MRDHCIVIKQFANANSKRKIIAHNVKKLICHVKNLMNLMMKFSNANQFEKRVQHFIEIIQIRATKINNIKKIINFFRNRSMITSINALNIIN